MVPVFWYRFFGTSLCHWHNCVFSKVMHTDKCNRDRQYTTLQDRGATFARDNGWKRLGNMDRIIHWWFFTYCYIQSIPRLSSVSPEHVSGAGAENGAERARKSDERERDLKKYGGARAGGRGSGAERSGERAESAAHSPLKPNNDWFCKLSYIRILQSISESQIRQRSSL